MWEEFKKFAFQGNVFDLAVAVVIGTAFGQIVNSLVEHIIMPTVGILFNGINFETLATKEINGVTIPYGMFIQAVFDFFVIALSIFFFIRILMKFRKKEEIEAKKEASPTSEQLLTEIRDLLKEQR